MNWLALGRCPSHMLVPVVLLMASPTGAAEELCTRADTTVSCVS